jgi:hypothetical protein
MMPPLSAGGEGGVNSCGEGARGGDQPPGRGLLGRLGMAGIGDEVGCLAPKAQVANGVQTDAPVRSLSEWMGEPLL